MGLLSFFFPERRSSALIAKDRLKIVLAHERASRDAPDFLPILQKELLDVVGRYVEIRGDMIRVNLGRSGETSLLEINVEIDGARMKLANNGAPGGLRPNPARPVPVSRAPAPPAGAARRFDGEREAPWVKPG
jgi:cell division topological specificity factor